MYVDMKGTTNKMSPQRQVKEESLKKTMGDPCPDPDSMFSLQTDALQAHIAPTSSMNR